MSKWRDSFVAILVAFVGVACGRDSEPARPILGAYVEPAFVGRAVCTGCHEAEADAWQGSHHDLAIQPADGETVLGDFSGTTLKYFCYALRRARRQVLRANDGRVRRTKYVSN